MDMETPTATVYAGSLARTYEYQTAGVPTTPRLRWSFAVKPGAHLTCPTLVSQDRVYIADSAGYVSALDAHSGDLVWSFPTDWVENPENLDWFYLEGVTAFCLDGALGYVTSAHGTLYELDLPTGKALRSWQAHFEEEEDEEDIFGLEGIEALFIHRGVLFLLGWTPWSIKGIYRFDRRTEVHSAEPILLNQHHCHCAPTVFHHTSGNADLIFGFYRHPNHGDTLFAALSLAGTHPDDPHRVLWYTNALGDDHDPRDLFRTLGYLSSCNMPLLDGTLYVFSANMWDTLPEWRGRPALGPFLIPGLGKEFAALLALEPGTGAVKWSHRYPYGYSPLQMVATDHLVFLVSMNQIEAIDGQTHQPRWTWEAAFPARHAFVADGLLYVLGTQGEIVALETSTGARRWNWQVEGEILKDWSTIDNGTLYIATTDTLFALRP
jgi:outer membrane protein assembly factor BamB